MSRRKASEGLNGHDPVLMNVFTDADLVLPASIDALAPTQRSESDERSARSSRVTRTRSRGTSSKRSSSSSTKKERIVSAAAEETPLAAVFTRENTAIARQSLTSSASRVRPSKQRSTRPVRPSQQLQTTPLPKYLAKNNNHDEEDESVGDGDDDSPRTTGETTLYERYRVPTTLLATDKGSLTQADLLPPRIKRYLNLSVASGDMFTPLQAEAESEESQDHSTRPPSRQRHAFPTHLLDNRDFLSPKHDSKISVTPWHHEDEGEEEQAREEPAKTQSVATTSSSTRQERPPSRYMTKKMTIQRVNSHSSTSSSQSGGARSPDSADGEPGGRLPSRRGGAASWNQAHHDPKTDGFAEVDESVPPPFRIEITTDSYQSQYIPASESNHRINTQDVDDVMLRRQGMLQARRWSSFGSNAQLKQQLLASMRTTVSEEAEVNHLRRPPPPREWLQRPEHPPHPTVGKAPLEPETTDCQPQRRSRESIMPPTSNNQATHQWFRSSTNPFFCASAATTTSAYEAMDFDTAIANTPLFEGDNDLMALPPLSDLHLDDFLGDPIASTAIPVPVAATEATAGIAGSTLSAMKLHTSLGKDFLSLFAQH